MHRVFQVLVVLTKRGDNDFEVVDHATAPGRQDQGTLSILPNYCLHISRLGESEIHVKSRMAEIEASCSIQMQL